MSRVVVVGAGLYGLIAAKTYRLVAFGDKEPEKPGIYESEIPACFTQSSAESDPALLVVDAASGLGGTWASDRLYPNLLSQNSYGLYEFSDLPLASVVSPDPKDADNQFIAGWKINRYLHVWSEKWDLLKHMRFNWKVSKISRLPTKEWRIEIITNTPSRSIVLICDKLILATGLTSQPFSPDIPHVDECSDIPKVHAKDVGTYCRERFGYHPLPDAEKASSSESDHLSVETRAIRRVAIQGGAKSSFDFVHLFASLHRNSPDLQLNIDHQEPIDVHWIIREQGAGVAWMAPPTSKLPSGQSVASDKEASTRICALMTPCVYSLPKRITLARSESRIGWSFRIEGSWTRRFLHGNFIGRFVVRQLWKSVDCQVHRSADYTTDAKMEKLRPTRGIIDCASSGGIANHSDLWETIRSPNVHVHRAEIQNVSGSSSSPDIHLTDGTRIPSVDLIVQATGYKPIVPIEFDPPELGYTIGLGSDRPNSDAEAIRQKYYRDEWRPFDDQVASHFRRVFNPSMFSRAEPTPDSTPYRLFRRMVSPELVAEGDRSFVALGVILTGTIAVVAEVQALWAAAFLTGGLDGDAEGQGQGPIQAPLSLNSTGLEGLLESVSEDVVWASLTGSGLDVDAITYNDTLLRDLGLNPYRLGGGLWREMTGVYCPNSYKAIVDEYRLTRTKDDSGGSAFLPEA